MRELKLVNGGHRINYNSDLMHLNNAIRENTMALTAFFGTGASVYLNENWKVVIAGNAIAGDPAHDGQLAPNSGGAMIYKGELCLFDYQDVDISGSGTLIWEPDPDHTYDTAASPVIYLDGSTQHPHAFKKVRLRYATTLPTDYVVYTDVKTPLEALKGMLYGTWQDLTLETNWNILFGDTPQIKLDADGKVSFRGRIYPSSLSGSSLAFYIPSQYRSSHDIAMPILSGGGGYEIISVSFDATGECHLALNTYYNYTLHGLSYYI